MTRKVENETVSKRRRKPGRLYWLWSFAVGVYSPRKGQRRIAADMRAKDERIDELEAANVALQEEYRILQERTEELVALSKDLQSRLDMADGVAEMNKVKTAADKVASTVPLRVLTPWGTTDPGVINTRPGESATNSFDRSSKVS